jgi:hypothetical protein
MYTLIVGIILLAIGFSFIPFMERFWHPGFFGAPTPRGWRGVNS